MCMPHHFAPPPPELIWAPTLDLVDGMVKCGLSPFFVTVIDTPCGRGTFVNRSTMLQLVGDEVTVKGYHERFPYDTPAEDQQWVGFTLTYIPGVGRDHATGAYVPTDEPFLDDMPDVFAGRPANIEDVVGYAESLLVL